MPGNAVQPGPLRATRLLWKSTVQQLEQPSLTYVSQSHSHTLNRLMALIVTYEHSERSQGRATNQSFL